jgi:hypothetical protein
MELLKTNHRYYCSESNYYVNGYENWGRCDYDTWQDFKDEWLNNDLTIDHDYNHCFRFDIKNQLDEEKDEEILGRYYMELFFILQRKGIFRPVIIKEIVETDMPDIEAYLQSCWNYMQGQWAEFSTKS